MTRPASTVLVLALSLLQAAVTPAKTVFEVANPAELDAFLQSHADGFTLVVFYSPFCGACSRFSPIFEAAARQLSGGKKSVDYLRLNAYEHPTVMPRFHVTAFPTVLLFADGKQVSRMPVEMSSQEFLVCNWIRKETGMPGAVSFFAQRERNEIDAGLKSMGGRV